MRKIIHLLLALLLVCGYLFAANPFAQDSSIEVIDAASGNLAHETEKLVERGEKKEVKSNTIAVMADLHTRAGNVNMIEKAFARVSNLKNLYGIVLAGDLCRKIGSPDEYNLLESMVNKLSVPVFAVPGNHDLIYKDQFYNGEKRRASPAEKKEKQNRFKQLFKLKSLYYSKKVASHLLIFLPNDSLSGIPLVLPSEDAYDFLRKTLKENPDLPTIVFCHAPIEKSYGDKKTLPPIHANLQPAARIRKILKENPQVYLWFAGHLHLTPGQKFYNFSGNKVGKVNVVHVPPVKNDRAWVQTLRLLPNGAIVRTMDVKTGKYLKKHNRVFAHRIKTDNETKNSAENKDKNEAAKLRKAQIVVVNAHSGGNHEKEAFGEWLADLEPDISLVSEAVGMQPHLRQAGRVFNAGLESRGQREVAVVVRHGLAVTEHDKGKVSPDLGLGIAHDRWWTMIQTRIAGVKARVYSLHLNAVIQQSEGEPRPVKRWEVTREGLEKLEKIWKKDIQQGWAVIVGGDLNWNNSRKNANENHMAPGRVFKRLKMKLVNTQLMWLAWTQSTHQLVRSRFIPPTNIPGLIPGEHPALNILLQPRNEPEKNSEKHESDLEEKELCEVEEESDTEDFSEVDAEISELESEDSIEVLINTLNDDFATGTLQL